MRGFFRAVVSLVLALASTAQTAPQADKAGEKQAALCAVSGQVLTAVEGSPLKSSRVVLLQEGAGSHPQAFAANTDSDGRFEIKKVTPGQYKFVASHAGYVSQQYKAKGMGSGAVLRLAPGQEIDDGLFRLVRAAVVTGRVVDESGEPMARVTVTALRKLTAEEKEDWGPQGSKQQLTSSSAAVTDDRGEYRIFGLKPGEYYVKAAESDEPGFFGLWGEDESMSWTIRTTLGSRYAPVFYPGVLQVDQAQPVALGPGDEVDADFAMRHIKTLEVAGRVVASDGRPATHAYIQLYTPEAANDELSASTNSKGEFSIKGVPPGSYVLSAHQADENERHMAQQRLEVGNDNIDSVLIAFGKGASIRGRIVAASAGGNALDQIRIHLDSTSESDTASFAFAQVKRDGSFQITDVVDGSYALRVYGLEQGWYVKSARMGAEDVLQNGLGLERGPSGGTLEIAISSATAELEGAVTENDKPVAGAQVRVKPDPETPYNRIRSTSASTDQNGHFSFNTLPPGKYRIIAKMPSTSSETPDTSSEAKTVTLGEHDHQAVQLTLAAPPME
jgi:protocatechuate 3,4-dioxygenase beta subunit